MSSIRCGIVMILWSLKHFPWYQYSSYQHLCVNKISRHWQEVT